MPGSFIGSDIAGDQCDRTGFLRAIHVQLSFIALSFHYEVDPNYKQQSALELSQQLRRNDVFAANQTSI